MPLSPDVELGPNVIIPYPDLVNMYGCRIGADTRIGPFVEIQKNVTIGRLCKISSHSFICDGVVIEDEVFIGHGVMFVNDRYPRATADGMLQTEEDWEAIPVRVQQGASLGTRAVIMCGVTLGRMSLVGAGAVVTKDVPDYAVVVGSPARVIGDVREKDNEEVLCLE